MKRKENMDIYSNIDTFILYLEYGEHELTRDEIRKLNEEEYRILRDHFFNFKEGHDLKATFDEFTEAIGKRSGRAWRI